MMVRAYHRRQRSENDYTKSGACISRHAITTRAPTVAAIIARRATTVAGTISALRAVMVMVCLRSRAARRDIFRARRCGTRGRSPHCEEALE